VAVARIGISGWRYAPWRSSFYPPGLPQRLELNYAAQRMTAIEINGTFYSLQRPSSFAAWRADTPDGFVFAVKGGRFITHLKRLVDIRVPLANFFASGVLALGDKLGPVLWQLPATLPFDRDVLAGFLGQLPTSTGAAAALAGEHDQRIAADREFTVTDADRPLRHALEPRHPSFAEPAALDLLTQHGVAMVLADAAGRWPVIDAVTADFCYLRLHGATELYTSGYSSAELDAWAGRIGDRLAQGLDVFAFFDNDAKVRAPFDAQGLISRLPRP
jgi:uncharacterized protein YecE (DUF72 family)